MQKIQKEWWLVTIAAVVVAVAVTAALTNNKTTPAPSTNSTTSTKPPLVKNNVIQQQPSKAVGTYLTDPKGRTLYTYDKDKSGVSNCSGECLKTWPIYGPSANEGLPSNLTVIKRSDGASQFAYKGQPLYYFVSDTAPGAVLGNGLNGFHVAVL